MSAVSVSRMIREAQKAGLAITGVEKSPDGTVRILTAGQVVNPHDELEEARARRRARKVDRVA